MQRGVIGLVVGSLLLVGCGQAGRVASAPEARMQARSFQNMTVQEAKAAMASDPALLVVDVREAGEFQAGHIPGALHRPVGQVANWSKTLDKDTRLLAVCRSGQRSALAAAKLVDYGFTNVASMTGGMNAWTAAGYPTATGQR